MQFDGWGRGNPQTTMSATMMACYFGAYDSSCDPISPKPARFVHALVPAVRFVVCLSMRI